jgi:benzodiazapine receptor
MSAQAVVRLIVCFALCFAVAGLGALATTPKIPTWYATLVKPTFTPPNWVFPVAWNILYALMALALFRLWQSPAGRARSWAVALFLLQLAVNLSWSWVFFGAQSIKGGLAVILLLDLLVLLTIRVASGVDRVAAALLLPYFLWIGYATALNAAIAVFNP